ncbi:MAG: ABC transporter substrate-binding protein [Candidatus Methanomethylophilaceae archaeon]|nr:ABC transporter substrate-binding protein [Candidatus Methanomethylophilaceae archaeon]
MDKKTLTVIAVVVVLVVVIAAVFVIMSGNSDKQSRSDATDVRLTVFGNANGDDYLDNDDVQYIQDIIDGKKSLSDAPKVQVLTEYGTTKYTARYWADANCDGSVNSSDLNIVKNIVNKTKGTEVKFFDVDSMVGTCTYPLTTYAVGYKSNYEAELILGNVKNCTFVDNQVGDGGSYAPWFQMFLDQNPECYGSRFTPDYEVFLDDAPSYILSGTRAWFDKNMEETVAPLGMDVVRLPFWEDTTTVAGILTLGCLCNLDAAAQSYAEKADKVLDYIQDYISGIKDEDRPLIFAGYNGTSISTWHNGIQELIEAAGGRTPYDVGFTNGSIDAEGVAVMNPDWIVFDMYYGFMETDDQPAEYNYIYDQGQTNNRYFNAIAGSRAYYYDQVLILGQGVYMGPASYIGIAWVFNHIYPNAKQFDVQSMLKDYISTYHPDKASTDYMNQDCFDVNSYDDWMSKNVAGYTKVKKTYNP